MNNKVLIGGLIGGVVYFLLGWLIYGMLLADMMKENYNQVGSRAEQDTVWWALILSNLFSGYFLAIVFNWGNVNGMASGLQKGAILGLFMGCAFDFGIYAFSTMFTSTNAVFMDIVIGVVMTGITGGILGWYNGMSKKEA